jgi:hypothetical protein
MYINIPQYVMADATAHELLQRAKDHIAARRAAVHILKKNC